MSIAYELKAKIMNLPRVSYSQRSKLGVHINFVAERNRMLDFIGSAFPRVMLTIHHDLPFLHEAKKRSPETLLIGRYFVEDQSDIHRDPEGAAHWLVDRIMAHEDPYALDAWVGFNEVARHDKEVWKHLGRFDGEMIRLLHERDLKYVAGSIGVGHPSDLSFVQLPEIVDAWSLADYIAIHECCAPQMDDPRGMDPEQPGTGWFTLRFRKWYPLLPPEAQKPLIITEMGIDSGAAHWDPGAQGGWRSFCSAEEYLSQLIWYDNKLREDPYVAGSCIFCYGTADPTWDSFDIKGRVVDLLEAHLKKSWTRPSPASNFIKYHSHYLLLPQQVPEEGWQAIWRYADAFRITLGRLENDAMLFYGGLSHTISVIQPSDARLLFLQRERKKRGFTLDVIRGSWDEVTLELDWRAKGGERVP